MKLKKIYPLLFVFVFALGIAAQETVPTPSLYTEKTLKELRMIQKATMNSTYALDQTAYITNVIGPRLTGSAQAEAAVNYVADEMRKLGLDVQLQEITAPHWIRGEERGELVDYAGMPKNSLQKVILTALGGSIATDKNGLTAEILVVNDYDELRELGRGKVAGKIVLYNHAFDKELANSGYGGLAYSEAGIYRRNGAIEAAKLGALGVLVRSIGGSQNRLAHTGGMSYDDKVTKIPAAAVPFEDAERIAYLAKRGKVKMRLTLTPQTLPDIKTYNVLADLKGSEKPDEIVVVSGHLDSWDLGTGAIDDAAGVAQAMQTVQILKQLKLKPKRTIRVVAFMNEENGFMGARTYAEKADAAKHFAAIESDLGASHPIGFQFAGKEEAMPFFAPISKVLYEQNASRINYSPRGVGSDIGTLYAKGVPTFEPWFDQRTYFNYHHNAADTFDKIVPKELAENASVMAVLAYGLANLEQPLPR